MVPLSFGKHLFDIIAPAALFWPAREAILVADLHLEKASFFAQYGQMLPPYDSAATLEELAALITKTGARTIFCLGDNYHDSGGESRLEPQAAQLLQELTAAVNWHWIVGNHDPDVTALWGGTVVREWSGSGLILRHEASKQPILPEISGHYHPRIQVKIRGQHLSRRCFVQGSNHLIIPAFGALTGGMSASDEAIEACVGGPAQAIIGLNNRALSFPLPFQPQAFPADEPPPVIPQQLSLPLAIGNG